MPRHPKKSLKQIFKAIVLRQDPALDWKWLVSVKLEKNIHLHHHLLRLSHPLLLRLNPPPPHRCPPPPQHPPPPRHLRHAFRSLISASWPQFQNPDKDENMSFI